MDIPNSFRPDIDLEETTARLLKERSCNSRAVNNLLISCDDFLEKFTYINHASAYLKGTQFARRLSYTKEDLEVLSEKLVISRGYEGYPGPFLGFYLSALTNSIITEEETVMLRPRVKLIGLGSYLQEGTVIIKGHAGEYTGAYMKGGLLMVKGNVDPLVGYYKEGGAIIIEGKINDEGRWPQEGYSMSGGSIFVIEGDMENPMDYFDENGEIMFDEFDDRIKRIILP